MGGFGILRLVEHAAGVDSASVAFSSNEDVGFYQGQSAFWFTFALRGSLQLLILPVPILVALRLLLHIFMKGVG